MTDIFCSSAQDVLAVNLWSQIARRWHLVEKVGRCNFAPRLRQPKALDHSWKFWDESLAIRQRASQTKRNLGALSSKILDLALFAGNLFAFGWLALPMPNGCGDARCCNAKLKAILGEASFEAGAMTMWRSIKLLARAKMWQTKMLFLDSLRIETFVEQLLLDLGWWCT